jgi:23S rRNA U2552 (ribose-2'-O)-methylase RlmE/FtsJ
MIGYKNKNIVKNNEMELFKSLILIKKIPKPTNRLDSNDFEVSVSDKPSAHDDNLWINKKLERLKTKIDFMDNNIWLNVAMLSNPYEYIHPKSTKFCKPEYITTRKPISRAYYKMWEIMNIFPIFNSDYNKYNFIHRINHINKVYDKPCTIAHLAEGPGGFIQAVRERRKDYKDDVHAVTLKCKNKNKHIVRLDKGIDISYGNITVLQDITKFTNKFVNNKAYLVTADGGFENIGRESIQEQVHSHLIYSEIIIALCIQDIGGCFVLKIYDINTQLTASFIQLLSYCYEDVHIIKPRSSRPINSERYVVCTGFSGIAQNILKKLIDIKIEWSKHDSTGMMNNSSTYINSIYNGVINYDAITDFNFLYSNQQLNYVKYAIIFIEYLHNTYLVDKVRRTQIHYSIEWCKANNIAVEDRYSNAWNGLTSNTLVDEICTEIKTSKKQIVHSNYTDAHKMLYEAIEKRDTKLIKTYCEKSNVYYIHLLVYVFKRKYYELIPYFTNKIKLSTLFYYLTCDEIVELFMNIGYELTKKIVFPITKICQLYMSVPSHEPLKLYLRTYFNNQVYMYLLKPPILNMKHFIENEYITIAHTFQKNPAVSINIMKYALFYNNTVPFIKKLHAIVPRYVFTEQDIIKTIKYGNIDLIQYIISKQSHMKLYTKDILEYMLYYDFQFKVVLDVLKLCKVPQTFNIIWSIKRSPADIASLLDSLIHIQRLPTCTIQKLVNSTYITPVNVLIVLYKYNILEWNPSDVVYLKNKLSDEHLKTLCNINKPKSKYSSNPFDCLT